MTMSDSTTELAGARAAAEQFLESLGLEAYLYEVEPGDNVRWTIFLENATDDVWQRLTWAVNKRDLLGSIDNGTVRERLAAELSQRVRACQTR